MNARSKELSELSSKDGHPFIREAVFEQGYLACQVAQFLACQASAEHFNKVSRLRQV